MQLLPRPLAQRARQGLLDVVLDPAQRAAVELPPGGALLVLGEAGRGKTTVALHRLAALLRGARRPLRGDVVVATAGLADLATRELRRLGAEAGVHTYEGWARRRAKRLYRWLPSESEETPPAVALLKRHPALSVAIEAVAARPPAAIDDDPDAPRAPGGLVSRGDLQALFGDADLLAEVARAGDLPAHAVAATLARSRVQFEATTEEAWSFVTDRARLVAVDGRPLDAGTATEAAGTVDVEDYAVLAELERVRRRRAGRPVPARRTLDVLVLDEAQELAPRELAFLGEALRPGGTLVVAGDADQQTDATATFPGWDAALAALGRPEHAVVELGIDYRCPPEVVRVARAIVQSRAPVPAAVACFADAGARAAALARALAPVLDDDPAASVGIVCADGKVARTLAGELVRRDVPARAVYDGRFTPRGVQVAAVDAVKGLEVDYVVVPDADALTYPDTPRARRRLYVALTRARHQALLLAVGTPTPLVALDP